MMKREVYDYVLITLYYATMTQRAQGLSSRDRPLVKTGKKWNLPALAWVEIKAAAMKVDRRREVRGVSKTARFAF
jgi:hypothetical protein